MKQLLGTYSTTLVKYYIQTRKLKKINLFNAIPKTFKGVKFTVDGSANISLSDKMLSVTRQTGCLCLGLGLQFGVTVGVIEVVVWGDRWGLLGLQFGVRVGIIRVK